MVVMKFLTVLDDLSSRMSSNRRVVGVDEVYVAQVLGSFDGMQGCRLGPLRPKRPYPSHASTQGMLDISIE